MHGGLGVDHRYLQPWLDSLHDILHLIYYDHRGNGRSGRPPIESLNFEQFCADADALRDFLGFERVALLGHSYGGHIALEYALRYPDRLSHLLLVATSATFNYRNQVLAEFRRRIDSSPSRETMMRALAEESETDDQAKRRFITLAPVYFHNQRNHSAKKLFEEVIFSRPASIQGEKIRRGWDVTNRLDEIRPPTLILVGRDDFGHPVSQAEILNARIPHSKLVVFERSGHFPYVEEPQAFFSAIRHWLNRMQDHKAPRNRNRVSRLLNAKT